MKKHLLLLALGLTAAALIGCDKAPTDTSLLPSTDADVNEIYQVLDQETDLFPNEWRDTGISDEGATNPKDAFIAEEIVPVRFGREVESVTHDRDVEFTSDTTATVTFTKTTSGVFRILALQPDSTRIAYEKPFSDHSTRYAYMVKRRLRPNLPLVWLLTGVSGTLTQSDNGTVAIQSVTFSDGTNTTTITNPLQVTDRRNLPAFAPGSDVTITVTTTNADDALFLFAAPRAFHRRALEASGNNSYTITWRVPRHPGVHVVSLDALSHGTLFDSVAPYQNMGWSFSYRINR